MCCISEIPPPLPLLPPDSILSKIECEVQANTESDDDDVEPKQKVSRRGGRRGVRTQGGVGDVIRRGGGMVRRAG